jgi:hypothetical protein
MHKYPPAVGLRIVKVNGLAAKFSHFLLIIQVRAVQVQA